MNPEQIVLSSASAAANTVGTNEFAKFTQAALTLTRAAVERHLNPADKPGLLAPVDVSVDGKDRFGVMLVLMDRVVIAWTTGTFRIKNFETVIPRDAITSIETTVRPAGTLTPARDVMQMTHPRGSRTIIFPANTENGRRIAPWMQGMLTGRVEPVFDRG